MSRFLSRVGAFSAGHRGVVAVAWVLVTAVFALLTVTGAKFSDSAFSIAGAESTTALATMEREFPERVAPDEGELLLVVQAADGATVTDAASAALVGDLVARAQDVPSVLSASDPFDEQQPFVSEDGTVAVSTLAVELETDGAEVDQARVEADLRAAAADLTAAGLRLEVGGALEDGPPEILGPTEAVGAVVAFVVLLITFGSLAAAGANMLMALAGVAVGVLGVLGWSATGEGIQSTTLVLAVMLGLAVGIDYTLFILSRFRDELRAGLDTRAAIARATGTAGSSVVVAGATVVIALAGLALVRIPFITEMGLGAAFGVVVAVLLSLTAVPAVLAGMGRKALPKRERDGAAAPREDSRAMTALSSWVHGVVRRPVVFLVAGTAVVAALAAPALGMATELDVPGGVDPASSQRAAYTIVSDAFGAGEQDPLIVLFEGADPVGAAEAATATITGTAGVVDVSPPQVADSGDVAFLAVTSEFGPADARTSTLVEDLRSQLQTVEGATASVTGQTAVDVDVNAQLASGLVLYLIAVSAFSILLLTLVFRSIAIPLLATVGFLMSLAAGLGVTTLVFQDGVAGSLFGLEESRPIASLVPIIVVGVLFGLAMDYQVFLVSRIHEAHRRGLSTRQAVVAGFGQASPVVLAAATIMAAVFAGFALSGGDPMVSSIGLALAVGVLVDALLVRMVLVPAALELMGEASWWIPRWLDRVLPDLDVEGHGLTADDEADDAEVERDRQPELVG
ncbi:MMPL family transporter [Modestobacter sp. L9-4]|uniref:MMPL family transporter n=1 Tax=Modestobacter sp. L9-4 TaxID=2851567 RepID=UPI001C759197|nr:MMPL family transporter [Modestobacter sp. L9-4]QXG74924.1 MMPL family transporter [Modestobacter sp. L9-4]